MLALVGLHSLAVNLGVMCCVHMMCYGNVGPCRVPCGQTRCHSLPPCVRAQPVILLQPYHHLSCKVTITTLTQSRVTPIGWVQFVASGEVRRVCRDILSGSCFLVLIWQSGY